MILYSIAGLFIIISAMLWIWAFTDCLIRPDEKFPNKKRKYEKLFWIIVVMALPVIGSLIYLFVVKMSED